MTNTEDQADGEQLPYPSSAGQVTRRLDTFVESTDSEPFRYVKFEQFRSNWQSWGKLFDQAARFASDVGPDRLITISHSSESVVVWYWSS